MDEIARGGATTVQRALRWFDRGADADEDGGNRARIEVDGAFKRVTPSLSWNQQAAHTTRACWYGS